MRVMGQRLPSRRLSVMLIALAVASCATTMWGAPGRDPVVENAGDPPSSPAGNRVLVIGLDGLGWDAIDRFDAPNLQALAARGTRPQALLPTMPTKTFVNFYTLATGLDPENHGMVGNSPYDRALDTTFTNQANSEDSHWWQGEPIWHTAERQGLRSHILFWPGSEVTETRATVWSPYEHGRPYEQRVSEVLAWYDAPETEMPDFAAVYFDHVDTIIHRFGADTEAEADAIAHVDDLVGDLIAGLESRGLLETTNIIVMSDHGLADLSLERIVFLDDYDTLEGVFINEFRDGREGRLEPYLMAYGEAGPINRLHDALTDAHPNMQVFRRGEGRDDWAFDHPTRGPDLLILADTGWMLGQRVADLEDPWLANFRATHGWDNADPRMHASLIAAGPAFPEGATPDAVENVNVHAIIACALGIDPAAHDGDAAEVARITGGRC